MSQILPDILAKRVAEALAASSKADELPEGFAPEVTPTNDPKFGDYQANAAMVLAKALRMNPRQFATELVEKLQVDDLCETPEIAGPGFINFRLKQETVATHALEMAQDDHLGVPRVEEPKTIVIDFSAPNIAKAMHVGHIRSTIIGDCLARVARFVGHNVITDNHIGDWGTQFGMVIYGWKNFLDQHALQENPIGELLRVYKTVNAKTKEDEAVLNECREELVKLQQGDPENLDIWKRCVEHSLDGLAKIYQQLDVTFDHYLGESFYNNELKPLVARLIESGIAKESDEAICIFSDESLPPEEDPFKIQRDGEWNDIPAMIQKSDGGFLYATTDIATLEYRIKEWNADEVWYVVGAPQQLHFRQIFDASRRLGHSVKLVHVAFGSILGNDRKPFKTRDGSTVGLQEVLTESMERALTFLEEREKEDDRFLLPEEEKPNVARVVGLGSVKYAELSQARMTDYIFDWDKMLSLKGNTAPYLLNAYVRTRGIFRKLEGEYAMPEKIEIEDPAERVLAMKLIQFGEVVPSVLNDHKPNLLAAYLFDLAKTFHSFFEACPVLKSEGITRESRLMLCDTTSNVLKQGLNLLGIEVTDRM